MGAQHQEQDCNYAGWCVGGPCACLFVALFTVVVIACAAKGAVYSVTVTGVAGLDDLAAANNNLPLSPVFNLTVRIDNSRELLTSEYCIGRLSTVSVSYNDALLARASVPEFCAEERKVRKRGVRAWGQGVALPQFLRDQLAGELAAGEAAVDVKVTTPAVDSLRGDTVFVCSQAKIGGGPAKCRKENVYHHEHQEDLAII